MRRAWVVNTGNHRLAANSEDSPRSVLHRAIVGLSWTFQMSTGPLQHLTCYTAHWEVVSEQHHNYVIILIGQCSFTAMELVSTDEGQDKMFSSD